MVERTIWLACILVATVLIIVMIQELNSLRVRVQTAESIIFDWRENYVIWPKGGLKTK